MANCECGCGQETSLSRYSDAKRGYVKDQPMRFMVGHQGRGRKQAPETIAKRVAAALGRPVSAATRAKLSAHHKAAGIHPSAEAHAKSLENRSVGSAHHLWRGGVITRGGRRCVYAPDHPHAAGKYVYEYRLVAEQSLGRYLEPLEVVHHIDGNKNNNAPENLRVFASQSEHIGFHRAQGDVC